MILIAQSHSMILIAQTTGEAEVEVEVHRIEIVPWEEV
jgi:hypothetical protein